MQEQNLTEVWQVDVNGTVYDAPFGELGEWIDAGSLLPQDKVRKGNLRWIEARRVPSLVPFFNAKAAGQPMPVVVTETVAEAPPSESETDAGAALVEPISHNIAEPPAFVPPPTAFVPDANFCLMHPELASVYFCDGCANGFCKACPNSYGGTVKICPMCGAMCRSKAEVAEVRRTAERSAKGVTDSFGAADFFKAFGHPFKFKTSLIFGAFLFAVLSIGKGAGAMGGIFMMVGGIFSGMTANALTFGVLANTIDNFIQGKLDANFMPDFEDFSIWDDVIHPFFLSIAAYVSAFGPFLIVLAVGFYLVTSSVDSHVESYKQSLEKIPGTDVYAGRELADQTGDVKDALKGIDQRQRERIAAINGGGTPSAPVLDEESRQQEELWAAAQENQKKSLESALGKSPETEAQEQSAMIQGFLNLAAPLVVIGGITFLWGLFFFPAACAVAGYSRTFVSTINPLVGLDTIKRLGFDYVKILVMFVALIVLSAIVSAFLAVIFSAFNLPMFGNFPATVLGAFFTFYISVVFSCVLGFALYKSADKLGLAH